MFSFLIQGEVNDDAVKLKTFANAAFSKYAKLSRKQLQEIMQTDFPGELHYIGDDFVNFVYPELREFQFMLDIRSGPDAYGFGAFMSVLGRGKYAGFMLHASDNHWHCSATDSVAYRATACAKKLAQMMEKKFDIPDTSRLLDRFR